ncbi:hypothetical protein GCM10022200_25880 [Microbacterium awajiense]|uniref:Exo-alpha-sialidase n=1 Tax=Microbacterium awajiense TaxID=415214 RepID=A0ABP7AW27_9MICO
MITRPHATATAVALIAVALTGCAAADPPPTGDEHATDMLHVHAIVTTPGGDGYLLGTHEGIYAATPDGQLGDRVGDEDFDAMGLTASGEDLIASGHPGRDTSEGLGAGNLGIIRSDDGGITWDPVAFTGEKDFHALTAAPDGTLYGQATDSGELLSSTDSGVTWQPTGATLFTFGLAVDATGGIIAVTPDGLQLSTDGGASFAALSDAPKLYVIAASPDHQRLVGVGTDGAIWSSTAGGAWQSIGAVHGAAQAITIADDGEVLVVDDSGVSLVRPDR